MKSWTPRIILVTALEMMTSMSCNKTELINTMTLLQGLDENEHMTFVLSNLDIILDLLADAGISFHYL